MVTSFERLFRPGLVGALKLANRIVMPPMATNYADPNGFITDRQIAYYRERARGGAGYLTFEHTGVLQEGKAAANMAMISSDDHVPSFQKLVHAVHQEGGKIVIQINHGGRQTSSMFTGLPLVAPSSIPCPTRQEIPKELSPERIHEIIQAFAQAAYRVKQAEADGVEIHMAHGYLLNGFLSPFSNHRQDDYGGTAEKRLRVPLEVLRAVRQKLGRAFPVICRISGDEYVPGGLTIEDTQKIARALEAHGADGIHVSATIAASGYLSQPPYYVPEGVFSHLAAGIRSVVKVPVIAVGRIRTPQLAEEILKEGKADFVSMGRALIADPHLPRKAQEQRLEEIIPCISCNRCIQSFREGNLQCAVNPRTGREGQFKIEKVSQSKKVWVIGGGPAGMKAAEVAARRGHEVTLYEKEERLGGRFLLAAIPPEKQILKSYVDYLIRQLRKQPVRICLRKSFDPMLLGEDKPDAVILATGARAYLPSLEGIQQVKTVTADDVLSAGTELPGKVLVLGGGGIGAEIADYLAERGKEVTLVEMREGIALDMPWHMQHYLRTRLRERGVVILTQTKAVRFDQGVLVVEGPEGSKRLDGFDTVVVSAGSRPNNGMVDAVKKTVGEVYIIGDAAQPRELMHAVFEGEEIGLRVCQ
jgi:2,4-dienoyl-CoA reductase-like NADH-dependent reductase (Old Yellow Enzyme family)/thioredoxin reductase